MAKDLSLYSQFTQQVVKIQQLLSRQVGTEKYHAAWIVWWGTYVAFLALLAQLSKGLAQGIAATVLLGSILVASGGTKQ